MAMCSQETSWGTQSPYQVWLSRKVEGAVERALCSEGQQILEEFTAPRKWTLPDLCEERHLVTTKIHSLLLQWRPDFSAEWSLKLRRALPILENLFAHLASSREDFSNPLLIEPRLKGVLFLLDSNFHNRSPPWSIQNSTHHRFANYLYCFQHSCHHICSADQIEGTDKACASQFCLPIGEERARQNGQESSSDRSCLDADKDGQHDKGHEVCVSLNVGEPSENTHKAVSAPCESCLYWEDRLDTKAPSALVFGSCLGITDEHDEGFLDYPLEWSTINLPSRGTVASLMASELRSSRKEEANQALWNALASEEVALLKDNLHKHGEFASKWMVRKIKTMLRRSKTKEKEQKVKKTFAGNELLEDAAGEIIHCAESPTSKIRKSFSRGLSSLFSCHTIMSREGSLPTDQKPLPADLDALKLNHPNPLVCIHSEHEGHSTKEDDVIDAEMPISCSSSLISSNAATLQSSSDVDTKGNDSGSSHTIQYHANNPMNETSASLDAHSTRSNSSEELLSQRRSKDSDDRQSKMLSENVSPCSNCNIDAGVNVKASSPGHGCIDMQVNLQQIHLLDSNVVVSSNLTAHSEQGSGNIMSVDEGAGHIEVYDLKGASTVLCNGYLSDSGSCGSLSVVSHDNDDDKDGIRPSAYRSTTDDPVKIQKEEGACSIESCTGVKGRSENLSSYSFSLERLARGRPCKTSMDIRVDGSGNTKKHRNTNNTFSHGNSNDQKLLAEDKMQTNPLRKDGESQEEGTGTSNYLPQDPDKESQVAQDFTRLGSMQSGDGESSSGSQRERTPLSSLLAETEDWNMLTRSFHAWGSYFPWDTWEEPNEALDPVCCVCMMGLKGAAFTPCGHTFCRRCSRELWQGRGTCPLCNKLIIGILDIF